jgi:hypothetical protein
LGWPPEIGKGGLRKLAAPSFFGKSSITPFSTEPSGVETILMTIENTA